jgi:hypothetical protein
VRHHAHLTLGDSRYPFEPPRLDAALRLLEAAEVSYEFFAETPLPGSQIASAQELAYLENQWVSRPPDSLSRLVEANDGELLASRHADRN